MRTTELIKKLSKADCRFVKHGANHDWWYSPITDKDFLIPRHPSQEVATGTLKNISKLSGVKL